MLMTQRLQLPSVSDEELSQFTESDGGSVASIEGIQPIEDTPPEVSEASDDDDDLKYVNSWSKKSCNCQLRILIPFLVYVFAEIPDVLKKKVGFRQFTRNDILIPLLVLMHLILTMKMVTMTLWSVLMMLMILVMTRDLVMATGGILILQLMTFIMILVMIIMTMILMLMAMVLIMVSMTVMMIMMMIQKRSVF